MKLSVIVCLLLNLAACKTTPEIKYVDRIVEVHTSMPPQLIEQCYVSKREGDTVYDYIVSENRLRTDLAVCNEKIKVRNDNEKTKTDIQIKDN